MKNVILLGKGAIGIKVANWLNNHPDFDLKMIVPAVPEPTWTDSIIGWAEANGIPHVPSGKFGDIPNVRDEDWQIDLAISIFYDRIIRGWFIDKCGQIVNLHNSPLPKYRGVSPINWALKHGESFHGATIHEITPGVDDGPIIGQVKYSIYPDSDEVQDVYQRALGFGFELVKAIIPRLGVIKPVLQDESEATFYHSRDNHLLDERRSFTREHSLQLMAEAAAQQD
ncbi:MAG: methionyl-tRNA formyltransferase [Rhodothermales bacterium]|jgi:methionyl-tRNA formyltransferase